MTPHWHLIAHVSELVEPGDFVCLPVEAGTEIAVMNFEGYLTAFDNRCPHRGARIFTTTHGNRPPVCGYHGRCARPMSLENRFSWTMHGGFIFVSRDALRTFDQPQPLVEFVNAAPAAMRIFHRQQFVMDCDWTVAIENALDLEHVEHVHAETLAKLGLKRSHLFAFDGHASSMEEMQSSEALRLDKLEPYFRRAAPDFQGFGPGHDYCHAYFAPYAAVSSTRGFTYTLQNYFPTPDGRTWFLSRMYTAPAPALLDSYFDGVRRINDRVFLEDAAICAQVPTGFAGKLGPRDDRIAAFRRALGMEAC